MTEGDEIMAFVCGEFRRLQAPNDPNPPPSHGAVQIRVTFSK